MPASSGFNYSDFVRNGQRTTILPAKTITSALANDTSGSGGALGVTNLPGVRYVALQSTFVYGSGGTTAKLYLQTSFDGGVTWVDVISHAFATTTATKISAVGTGTAPASQGFSPTDGTLTDNTVNNGVLGDRVRVKLITVGTYAGATSIRADVLLKAS